MPDRIQVYIDVWVALLDAVTDTFRVKRDDLDENVVPSEEPIGAGQDGWRLCLKTFEGYIATTPERGAFYRGYTHKERFVDETLEKNLGETTAYLRDEIVRLLLGASR